MKKTVIKLLVVCLLVSSICCGLTESYEAQTIDGKQPISPSGYQKLLGKGMDVDWSKTKKGRETYSKAIVQDFKKAGICHVRIRIKDDISEELFDGWMSRLGIAFLMVLFQLLHIRRMDLKIVFLMRK